MNHDELRPLESLPPYSLEALPKTIPSKMKSGRKVYIAWWVGVGAFILAVVFSFGVIAPAQTQNRLLIVIITTLLIFAIAPLFYITRWLIDKYNWR
jgi:high-affinity Fe2+/Pb2+ permease